MTSKWFEAIVWSIFTIVLMLIALSFWHNATMWVRLLSSLAIGLFASKAYDAIKILVYLQREIWRCRKDFQPSSDNDGDE